MQEKMFTMQEVLELVRHALSNAPEEEDEIAHGDEEEGTPGIDAAMQSVGMGGYKST